MSVEGSALAHAAALYGQLGSGLKSRQLAGELIRRRDREPAARLRAAGMPEAAALLDPPEDDCPSLTTRFNQLCLLVEQMALSLGLQDDERLDLDAARAALVQLRDQGISTDMHPKLPWDATQAGGPDRLCELLEKWTSCVFDGLQQVIALNSSNACFVRPVLRVAYGLVQRLDPYRN
ncbi:hypothetical protein ACIQCG_01045 [Streptomyces noursei]|uniref:hypothetical protein n=1 Tax=Streptomyces noursei TaxID=1971 RepID=UPI003803B82B